ncbi:hypothetical protein EGW08_010501 [Elysia chlorotica]|uniref:Thioredoxin domain-containing protein n=1 Tax=Elysia chlorotica TaxID=188477 RepID=A0A3S1BIR9_ELYCH|nr:hypothetical protein EGW08_010501 [Elysia chlorotica]
MSKKKFIKPISADKYLGTGKVSGLVACNFYHFLNEKHAALVMFYDPEDPTCSRLKPHMIRQAKLDKDPEHGYAAVNCLEEPELCQREGMVNLPAFKLYTRGKEVNKFGDSFDYKMMEKMIQRCPLIAPIHKTRKSVDPECVRPPAKDWRPK